MIDPSQRQTLAAFPDAHLQPMPGVFLRICFAIQSYLRNAKPSLATYGQARQQRSLLAYAALCTLSLVLNAVSTRPEAAAFNLGLAFPGAGFLYWFNAGSALPMLLFLGSVATFGATLIFWFATGNIVLPPFVWFGAALLASNPESLGLDLDASQGWLGSFLPFVLLVSSLSLWRQVGTRRSEPIAHPPLASWPRAMEDTDEIDLETLKRFRVILDRALQPIEAFEGFEHRDQFQTAALRYQVNFLSYALSLAHQRYAPSFTGYMREAQENLLAKQGSRKLWSYWALENAWGNLRLGRDPVPQGNIMYSGFVLLQMALAGASADLRLRDGNEAWREYSTDQISQLLAAQYRSSSYGLLACEPNWIYPLCNLITACGLRAADSQLDTERWRELSVPFMTSLAREFVEAGGDLVAFRSSLTGFAPPSPGGIVMQAFPCLFLNTLDPDQAERRWSRLRTGIADKNWRRAHWPIDVGNYGFTRASSLAACAAAAVEMGDGEASQALLELLGQACPSRELEGVIHRDRASLWAHALELMARVGANNAFRHLVESPLPHAIYGPYLEIADYPEILVASAKPLDGGGLKLVLQPGEGAARSEIGLAGLFPERHYRVDLPFPRMIKSDRHGRARIALELAQKTSIAIVPVI